MQKKIFQLLKRIGNLQDEEVKELVDNLRCHFFRELYSPIDFRALLPHIHAHQIHHSTCIFAEGEPIDNYFFLLAGHVNLFRKVFGQEDQTVQECNEEGILGQFFYHKSEHRMCRAEVKVLGEPCLVISVQARAYRQICKKQALEYEEALLFVTRFMEVQRSLLERFKMYMNIMWKQFRYGQQIMTNGDLYIIFQGECLMSHAKNGRRNSHLRNTLIEEEGCNQKVRLCRNDCINVQQYINYEHNLENKKEEKKYRYVACSQMRIISIKFDFILSLREKIDSKLEFIDNCHSRNLNRFVFRQNKNFPFIQRKSIRSIETKEIKEWVSKQRIERLTLDRENLFRKEKSLSGLNLGQKISPELVTFIRKKYCLGYSLKSKIDDRSLRGRYERKVVREPKGYFDLPKDRRLERKSHDIMSNSKDMSVYIQKGMDSKSKGKKNRMQKETVETLLKDLLQMEKKRQKQNVRHSQKAGRGLNQKRRLERKSNKLRKVEHRFVQFAFPGLAR